MRLHSLQLTAFGPFADTETVDFDALGADGLFLLHGETGAGKTTVLDAVAFALFGRVPGARSEAKRLLSDHAEPDARPEVQLELTVGGRRMRLVRSPEHERAKRRGAGTTRQNAKASLTWMDEPESVGLTRLEDIGTMVSQLLGMSAEQFFQVVLLPQGEFARFLRASTDERATVLKRLFDTGRFGDVETWFREQRKDSTARVEQTEAAQTVLLGKLATAAGVDDHDADGGVDPLGWGRGLAAAAESNRAQREQVLAVAHTAAKAARAALDAATVRASLLHRRRRAQQQIAVVDADRPRRAACEQELIAAHRAQPVAAAAADADDAQAVAAEKADAAQQHLAAVQADPDGARGLAAELGAAVAGWRSEVGSLTELAELADRSEADIAALAALREKNARSTASLADLDGQRGALPADLQSAELSLAHARRASESLPMLAAERDRAAGAAHAGAELVDGQAQLAAAARVQEAATQSHLDAKHHWLDLRERRLDGMAAELARSLQTGESCPVCGSAEHPAPAAGDAEHVGCTQEVAAHEAEQRAAGSAADAGAQLHELARTVDALTVRSGGQQLADLRTNELAARAAEEQAQRQAQEMDPAAQRVVRLRTKGESLDADARALRSAVAAATERIRSMQEQITVAQLRLSDACGDDPDVHARRDRLQRLAAAADALLAARSAADGAAAHAVDRHAKAERTAAQAGFADLVAALAAVRPAPVVQELQTVLDAAHNAETAAHAVLNEPEVAATPDIDVDLTLTQTACEEADAALAQAHGGVADATRMLAEVHRLVGELGALTAALGPELARHAELTALADVINGLGQNSRRMSLHSYVLAARLEEVAEVASVRLRRMSGDRYEFVHSDAPGARGTRGGLGLDIRDDYTGVVRSAKTLSGGESFLASLALALGLADVVAAESGGVLLDTLFIDEGFGSLDSGTLEEVMAVLDDLRAGGRVVGLVSHVDELRQRIPNRLLVHKGRSGSHLQLSSA